MTENRTMHINRNTYNLQHVRNHPLRRDPAVPLQHLARRGPNGFERGAVPGHVGGAVEDCLG